MTDALLSPEQLSRLKWRTRRGLLENDLFIEKFFQLHADTLTERQAEGMMTLMDLSDNDLLDLLLQRKQPTDECAQEPAVGVLQLLIDARR